MVNFPAPVGGTPLPVDFAPSIVFAVLYALLLPLTMYRMLHRRSRTTLLIGTVTFSIERIVIFSLRAVQSRNDTERLSRGLTTYMQISFGMGFVGIASDLANILRCLLVNPTYGSALYFQSPAAATKDYVIEPPPAGTPDQPLLREKLRGRTGLLGLAFLAATVTGILANTHYSNVFDSQSNANATARLRYVSTAIVLFLTIVLYAMAWWGRTRLPRISPRGIVVLGHLTIFIAIISVYRLVVMRYKTTSLTAPDPLNSHGQKAAFYILHVLPEWLITLVLVGYNVRKAFGTGPMGDWRWHDETEKEKQKRLKREAKKRSKTGVKEGKILDVENGSEAGMELVEKKKGSELVTIS